MVLDIAFFALKANCSPLALSVVLCYSIYALTDIARY